MPQCRESMQHKRCTDVIISVWGNVVLRSAWEDRPQIARSPACPSSAGGQALASGFCYTPPGFCYTASHFGHGNKLADSGFAARREQFLALLFPAPFRANGSWLPARHQPAAQLPSQVRCEVETGVSRVSGMGSQNGYGRKGLRAKTCPSWSVRSLPKRGSWAGALYDNGYYHA